MSSIAAKIFKYRSYTPIPFLILMLIYAEASLVSFIVGLVIALSGEAIRLWGVSWAGSETRTTGAGVGGTFLVISGPFAHVRNPLYVGNILIYLGIGIMSMALFPYLQIIAVIFFYFQYYLIVKEEESFLITKFKDDYQDYLKNVPRFGWRFTPYKNDSVIQPEFILSKGLKSETRSLQAFGIAALLIVIKSYLSYNNLL
ncbi:MAG: isoprenylcysteine carboxylmethyltransferase family protein [Ignavibacteriota bacterium]|mgnify:CR=1 FL=1|nr:isoprenylcysteine carboxylmethyltransferase family protein [Ignavibacteriota bacterium]MCO6449067.1 isoprenylcysteine carboxylmethyltransferase family protein [Ignavibacterium album]MEB2354670.1 isoprenylcysteine carboxylmethyltransferase family protein [Ignavibacteriales bacterium]HMN17854.1 isoprenylcysteine carboxylmethyltransferase family protein [Ignavibacteriaceae bacterium]QKJ98057.1 MAG: isoprenylcysteine carboxylmethyltransferase family protein [Ignavibacteriota bacterium]